MRFRGLAWLAFAVTACDGNLFEPDDDPDAPTDLTYQLIPSGDPDAPLGILLEWEPPRSGRAVTYDVYARSATREDFVLRATTTSPSFHDAGIPQLQYYVQALDEQGQEMGSTDYVEVDERNRLPAPQTLASTTLNEGVELAWSSNAYDADPDLFDMYRVYSTSFDVAHGCSEDNWALEGTTVSDGFVVRSIANGVTRCFAVSAVSRDGHESVWSNVRQDTPRFDARSVVVDASDIRAASAGFVFARSGSTAIGTIVASSDPQADFIVERRTDGLWLRAPRAEVRIVRYGSSAVSELTSIDRAPASGYADAVKVDAGFGYVFRLQYADGTHYGALRVVHVAADFVLFDFAYQPQAGSGELARAAP